MTILGTDNDRRNIATLAHSKGRVGLVLMIAFTLALGFALNQSGVVAQAAPPAATAPTLGAAAGFTVLQMRRTFLNGASLLVWARKDTHS